MNASWQASLSITNCRRLLKLMSIESVMPSNYLILCLPLLLLPSVFSSSRVFSNESVLCIGWPKYWGFSFSISLSNEYSQLISFKIDWLDLLAVLGNLKSLLQHHSSKLLRTIASHYGDAQPNSPATQKEQQPSLAGQSPRLACPEPSWNLQGILSSLAWLFPLWWASFKDCHLLQTIDFSSIFKYSKTPDLSFPIQASAVSPCYSFFSHPVMIAHRAPIWHKRLDWWQPKKLDKVY